MAMKPAAKAILILAVVSAIGFGLTKFDFKKLKPEAAVEIPAQTPANEPALGPAPAAQVPIETNPVAETPKSSNVTSGDAGMNAVLEAGKKK